MIDGARSSRAPVQPKKQVVYLASVLLGFLLPFAFIVLRALFETRIESEDTIKRLSSIPLIGRIPQGSNAEKLVMDSGRRSAITESFRMLRTRVHYWNPDAKNSVLLITSSQGGDGKTFVTLNLGMALALSNKKVVLLGLDLRKPKLYEYFGLEKSERGITDFLIGACALEDIIYPSAITPNLYCAPSGPSLSGFPEMIQYEKVEKMIGTLKEQYDIIVIDSPPIGLVADALLLSKLADSTIIVIRHKYTRRGMLKDLEELHRNGELTRPAILFNGVKSGSVYAGYGKDSGYGYYK